MVAPHLLKSATKVAGFLTGITVVGRCHPETTVHTELGACHTGITEELVRYHPKITVGCTEVESYLAVFTIARYHPQSTLHFTTTMWWLHTVPNVSDTNNCYRGQPWKLGFSEGLAQDNSVIRPLRTHPLLLHM